MSTGYSIQKKTAAYTALYNDLVDADPTGGAFAVTLPAASSGTSTSNVVIVKNISKGSNLVTINRAGTDLIDGVTSISLAAGDYVYLVSDGTSRWLVVARKQIGWFSVQDFGAVGDGNPSTGAGTDDGPAFQKTYDAMVAISGGGIIFLPPLAYGKGYKIATAITGVSIASGLTLKGCGSASKIMCSVAGARVIDIGAPQAKYEDLVFVGDQTITSLSAIIHLAYSSQHVLERVYFYGIAAANLVSHFNAHPIIRQCGAYGCYTTGGYVDNLGQGLGMDVDGWETQDYGVLDGVSYVRGSGSNLANFNLGDPAMGPANEPYLDQATWSFKNLSTDEGNGCNSIRAVPSGPSFRYNSIHIEGHNGNNNTNDGCVHIKQANRVQIVSSYIGLHPTLVFPAFNFEDAGDVLIRSSSAASNQTIKVDNLTKSVHLVDCDYPGGFIFTSTPPSVLWEIGGKIYSVYAAASAFSGQRFVKATANVGEVDVLGTSDVSAKVLGIADNGPAYAVGSITAIAKASLTSGEYIDFPDGKRMELANGGPINPADMHYDYSGVGATAINVATGLVASYNAFAGNAYVASNVGGTSATITFTAKALGQLFNGGFAGNFSLYGFDWHVVDVTGGVKNIRVALLHGQTTKLAVDGAYVVGDYVLPSNVNGGKGLKAASGNFAGLVVEAAVSGVASVQLGKFTA